MSNGYFIYSIIRKDIPLADQIVQTAHSAFHAGETSQALEVLSDHEIPALILLQVDNQEQLKKLAVKLKEKSIVHSKFFEPDDDLGYTSITTVPLTGDQRKVFSNYRLWRA
ncbi:hypothetical protein D3C87_278800 [compost metagenome]